MTPNAQPHQPRQRPWYCIDAAIEDYKTVEGAGGDLRMLKILKVVRSILVNSGIIAITLISLYYGVDPTIVSSIGLVILGAYNGIEIADYASLAQAVVEISEDKQNQDGQE
jgi:hypothetical protein